MVTIRTLAEEFDVRQKDIKAAIAAAGVETKYKPDDELPAEVEAAVRNAAVTSEESQADKGDESKAPEAGVAAAPPAPAVAGARVRVANRGTISGDFARITEGPRSDGSVAARLESPCFAGAVIELAASEWEAAE